MTSSGSCFQIFVFGALCLKANYLILGNNAWVGEGGREKEELGLCMKMNNNTVLILKDSPFPNNNAPCLFSKNNALLPCQPLCFFILFTMDEPHEFLLA